MNDDYAEKYAAYEQAHKAAHERNLASLFDKLAELNVSAVTVTFDGSGDDGQIEEIEFSPETNIAGIWLQVESSSWIGGELSSKETPLSDAVETICYGLLTQDNDGWENNDGAFGEFAFNVSERTVTLYFNARFVDWQHSDYTYTATAPQPCEPTVAEQLGARASALDPALTPEK